MASTREGATVALAVRTLGGRTLALEAEPSDTLHALRGVVAEALDVRASSMRLLYLGRDLSDGSRTLRECGMEAGGSCYTLHALGPAPSTAPAASARNSLGKSAVPPPSSSPSRAATATAASVAPATAASRSHSPESTSVTSDAAMVRLLRSQLAAVTAERDAAQRDLGMLQRERLVPAETRLAALSSTLALIASLAGGSVDSTAVAAHVAALTPHNLNKS